MRENTRELCWANIIDRCPILALILLITTIVVFNLLYLSIKSLEVVGRGSETQLQVSENLNKLT